MHGWNNLQFCTVIPMHGVLVDITTEVGQGIWMSSTVAVFASGGTGHSLIQCSAEQVSGNASEKQTIAM